MLLANAIVVAIVVAEVNITITSIYWHRGLAHRAIEYPAGIARLFDGWMWMTTGLRARQWVAIHRIHHRDPDGPGDPHSPRRLGFWTVALFNTVLYRRAVRAADVGWETRDVSDLLTDRKPFSSGIAGPPSFLLVLLLVTGRGGMSVAVVALSLVFYNFLNSFLAAMGHSIGEQPFENSATNARGLAFITAGEGLHNNHHAAIRNPCFERENRDFDLGWRLVTLLQRCRLCKPRTRRPSAIG